VKPAAVSEEPVMPDSRQPSIDAQREFWNSHWQHAEERKILNSWTERRGREILQTIEQLRIGRAKILDFGCGHGWFTERLANIGEVQGIDLSPEAIAIAKERRPDLKYFAGDIYEAELPEGYFDVVVSQEVISHVENQTRYVERAARVLKSAGYLVITTGNRFVMDRLGDVGWRAYPTEHIENELTRGDMRRLLGPKFKILSLRTIIPHGSRGILRLVNSYKLTALLNTFVSAEALNAAKERAGFGWQMIVLAQKKV
jgi:2-polyprenyl-3-methyl-5-hydroxy-6-metoxy-1,4-benzoquinol methylase